MLFFSFLINYFSVNWVLINIFMYIGENLFLKLNLMLVFFFYILCGKVISNVEY